MCYGSVRLAQKHLGLPNGSGVNSRFDIVTGSVIFG